MSRVSAQSERVIAAPPQEVYATLIDYQNKRPSILTPNFLDYTVEKGGVGEGTVISYRLQAGGRERPYHMQVTEPVRGQTLMERDLNSSLSTTWTLTPVQGGQQTKVQVKTSWEGARGIGGFFERTFAPMGLRRIYDQMLSQLAQTVQNQQSSSSAKQP
jgi:uncharacterized protein YndB with AHSA1/START domain